MGEDLADSIIARGLGTAMAEYRMSLEQVLGPSGGTDPEFLEVESLPRGTHDGDPHRRTALVDDRERAAVVLEVPVAPLHEREHCRQQVATHGREVVLEAGALAGLAVRLFGEDSDLDELLEPGCHDRIGDPDSLCEFVEARRAVEGLAEDQDR